MGVVWIATHLVTKRRVAIKLLRAGGHDDAASRARLLREARASCAVDHPSVLPVLDVIDADGAPALVMELLEGESLRERLERGGALASKEACTILAPVAGALAAAHAARIVHRDIKPENIFLVGLVGAEPTVKVLDFGIAKIVATEETTSNLTESGAMLGTPYYMAPEQAFGERDVGPAADAWALGIVLYECLTGTRPTQADNLGQVIKRITRDPIAPIEEQVTGVPPELAVLVGRLLERDVASREIDMKRAAKILATCAARDEREPAASTTSPARSARPASIEKDSADDPPKRWIPGVAIALGVALVLGLVASAGRWPAPVVSSADAGAPATTSASPPTASAASTVTDVSPPPSIPSAAPSVSAPVPSVKAAGPASTAQPAISAAPVSTPATIDSGSTGPGHVITTTPF